MTNEAWRWRLHRQGQAYLPVAPKTGSFLLNPVAWPEMLKETYHLHCFVLA